MHNAVEVQWIVPYDNVRYLTPNWQMVKFAFRQEGKPLDNPLWEIIRALALSGW